MCISGSDKLKEFWEFKNRDVVTEVEKYIQSLHIEDFDALL